MGGKRKRVIRDDGVIFESVVNAAKDARINKNNMSPVVKYQIRTEDGYRYRYEDEPFDNKTRYTTYHSKKLSDGTYKEQIVAVGTPSRIREILNIGAETLAHIFNNQRRTYRVEKIMMELVIK